MSDASDPVLGSVKLDVGADYNSLWGKTKEVRTFYRDYDATAATDGNLNDNFLNDS